MLSFGKNAEGDADPMADGATQYEQMPDEMHVWDFVHDKEDDADGVGDAFRKQSREAGRTERLAKLREGDDNHPTHDQIDGQREDVRPFGRAETGDENSRDGEAPLETEDCPARFRREKY